MKYDKEYILRNIAHYSKCCDEGTAIEGCTSDQIKEACCKWKTYLKEACGMTDEQINEGIIKKAVTGIKKGISAVGHGIAGAAKAIGTSLHDTFVTSQSIKKFISAVGASKKDGKDEKNVSLAAHIDNNYYPVIDVVINNTFINGRCLVLKLDQAGKSNSIPKNTAHLDMVTGTLKEAKITKISDSIEGVTCGVAGDDTFKSDATTNEAKNPNDIKPIDNNTLADIKYENSSIVFEFNKSKDVQNQENADAELYT